jgi:uncharacterized protein YdeI (YjbR/CyaY-like superfamily)
MEAPPKLKPDFPLLRLPDAQAWRAWLQTHHATEPGALVKLAKKGAPEPTLSDVEAIDTALCFGWIDGQVKRIDEHYYCLRFTPRRLRSKWSARNVKRALKLIESGEMAPAGLAEVQAAQADGRFDAAYSFANDAVPDDFATAIAADPQAAEFFSTISAQNRFSLIFRVNDAKRPETRAKRIAEYVAMLREHRTIH